MLYSASGQNQLTHKKEVMILEKRSISNKYKERTGNSKVNDNMKSAIYNIIEVNGWC